MDLNLRGVEDELAARHKANAALMRLTLKEYVVAALEFAASKVEFMKISEPTEVFEKLAQVEAKFKPEKRKADDPPPCPRCNGPMKDYGMAWLCEKHGRFAK